MEPQKSYLKIGLKIAAILKIGLKIAAIIVLVPTLLYAMVLLVLPATFFGMSMPFEVPESAGINPHAGRAIALTFGFVATALFFRFVIRWKWFEGKILAFGGVVAVFVAWQIFMWLVTTAPTRAEKAMGVLRQQNKAQQAQLVQLRQKSMQVKGDLTRCQTQGEGMRRQSVECGGKLTREEQAKAAALAATQECRVHAEAAQTECGSEVTRLNQVLASAGQDRQTLAAAQAQSVQELTQCRAETKAVQTQLEAVAESVREAQCPSPPAAVMQPAVYTPPSKPRAKVVVVKQYYNHMYSYGGLFDIVLVEKNGVPVVFDRMILSIWRRDSETQPIDEVKRNKPAVFERSGFEIVVNGSAKPTELRLTLDNYVEWLHGDEWVEIALVGTDANGYAHTLTFSGAD